MDVSSLVTGKNAMLPVGVFLIAQTVKQILPEFFGGKVGQRLLPLLPLVLGVALALGGLGDGAERWQDKVLVGLIAAFTAGQLFKVGKTSFLGWGVTAGQAPDAPGAPAAPSDKQEG